MKSFLLAITVVLLAQVARADLSNKEIVQVCAEGNFTTSECNSLFNFVIVPMMTQVEGLYGIRLDGKAPTHMSLKPDSRGEIRGDFTLSGQGITCTYPLVADGLQSDTLSPLAFEGGCHRNQSSVHHRKTHSKF